MAQLAKDEVVELKVGEQTYWINWREHQLLSDWYSVKQHYPWFNGTTEEFTELADKIKSSK